MGEDWDYCPPKVRLAWFPRFSTFFRGFWSVKRMEIDIGCASSNRELQTNLPIFQWKHKLNLVPINYFLRDLRGNPAFCGIWLPGPSPDFIIVCHDGCVAGRTDALSTRKNRARRLCGIFERSVDWSRHLAKEICRQLRSQIAKLVKKNKFTRTAA